MKGAPAAVSTMASKAVNRGGVMHPALIQAAAAERTRDHYARAAERRRTAAVRRARRLRPAVSLLLTGRVLRAA